MIKQTKIQDTKRGLDRYEFFHKCIFCNVFSPKTQSNACNYCFRYFNYVDENNVAILTLKNIFIEMTKNKFSDNLSCFNFLKLEEQLVDESENNPCFSYNPYALNWHIDFAFDKTNPSQISSIIQTASNIVDRTCEKSWCTLAEKSTFMDDIVNKIDNFDKNRNFKLPNIMPENAVAEEQKHNYLSIIGMNRYSILKNFYENLSFYD